MSKVVYLTEEQARRIMEMKRNRGFYLTRYGKGKFSAPHNQVLNNLSFDELATAFYGTYEVRPKYNIGDWVIHESGWIGKIIRIFENDGGEVIHCDNGMGGFMNTFRHATEEEVEEAKQRRFWNRLGRDVWELRKGDVIVSDKDCIFTVKNTDEQWVEFIETGIAETWKTIKLNYKLACTAENRLDIKKGDE